MGKPNQPKNKTASAYKRKTSQQFPEKNFNDGCLLDTDFAVLVCCLFEIKAFLLFTYELMENFPVEILRGMSS